MQLAEKGTRGRRLLSGKRALFEQLVADGVTSIFGNPGTTEQGFMDLLPEYPSITYYLALHEGVAIGMADAYARGDCLRRTEAPRRNPGPVSVRRGGRPPRFPKTAAVCQLLVVCHLPRRQPQLRELGGGGHP